MNISKHTLRQVKTGKLHFQINTFTITEKLGGSSEANLSSFSQAIIFSKVAGTSSEAQPTFRTPPQNQQLHQSISATGVYP